ncbi:MAG: TDP-N-acetylfucosamine:lipid II N-acetylfucosaminyltransferase [Aeromonas sp.]
MKSKILHVFDNSHHHNLPMIEFFLNKEFNHYSHFFSVMDRSCSNWQSLYSAVININLFTSNSTFCPWLRNSHAGFTSVIFHGSFNDAVWELIDESIDLCEKSSWLMFGGDLYNHLYRDVNSDSFLTLECLRKRNTEKLKSVIYNDASEDDMLVYDLKYPRPKKVLRYAYNNQNLMSSSEPNEKLKCFLSNGDVCLLGNSADPKNEHELAIKQLFIKNKKLKIVCPLNYGGDEKYINEIVSIGKELYGNSFFPIDYKLTSSEYTYVLSKCKYILLSHKRQQAVFHWKYAVKEGKVLIACEQSPVYKQFKTMGFDILNVSDLSDLELSCTNVDFKKNMLIHDENFSLDKAIEIWKSNLKEIVKN